MTISLLIGIFRQFAFNAFDKLGLSLSFYLLIFLSSVFTFANFFSGFCISINCVLLLKFHFILHYTPLYFLAEIFYFFTETLCFGFCYYFVLFCFMCVSIITQ